MLEDDAGCDAGGEFGAELTAFVRALGGSAQPQMVGLSDCFCVAERGIAHLLAPVAPGSAPWPIQSAEGAVTNTVCATLYRRPGDAWLASPAPLVQRSGVPTVQF